MIRLAHVSDIHVTAPKLEWKREDWFNKRLAAWLNYSWLGRRFRFRHAEEVLAALRAEWKERPPDRIIFSGDATALGFESEFQRAADFLGVGDGALGLAVPGNHDYCTIPAARSGLFERYFAPWQIGQRLEGTVYPFAQKVDAVWLVAVNSCTGNRWAWDAGGKVGPEQLDRLRRLLAGLSPGPRILVTHYPVCLSSGKPERRSHGLRDLEALVKVAGAGGVRLWLHGHRHHAYIIKTDRAPFPVVCAGSATQTGCWTYTEYNIDDCRLHLQQRIYRSEEKKFGDGQALEITLES